MITAEKSALRARLAQQGLAIQERELNWMESQLEAVGTQAALLAGFAFSGITISDEDIGEETEIEALFFYGFCAVSFACEVYCVVNTTFLTIWGPGLALRGPDGSMKRAVEGMNLERRHIYISFGLGLVALQCAAIAYSWAHVQNSRNAVPAIVTAILLASMGLTLKFSLRVYRRFLIPETAYITGNVQDENMWQDQLPHAWTTTNAATPTATNGEGEQGGNFEEEASKGSWKLPTPFGNGDVKTAEDATTRESELADLSSSGLAKGLNLEDSNLVNQDRSPASEGTEHQGPRPPSDMEGHLSKQNAWTRNWKKSYFLLSKDDLYYYRTAADMTPVRNRPINLQGYKINENSGARIVKLSPENDDDERRVWELRADTEDECNKWKEALGKILKEPV